MTNNRPTRRIDLATRDVGGDVMVYDPKAGLVHILNPVAAFVLALCDGSHNKDDIATSVATRFKTTHPTDICKDIAEILLKFDGLGLFSENGTVKN